jgi:hypothetical protein
MEVERALLAVVGSTLAGELAAIADEVTMAVGRGCEGELVLVAIVLARLRELREVLLRGSRASEGRAATTRTMAATASPPGASTATASRVGKGVALLRLSAAILVAILGSLLHVKAENRRLLVARKVDSFSELFVR